MFFIIDIELSILCTGVAVDYAEFGYSVGFVVQFIQYEMFCMITMLRWRSIWVCVLDMFLAFVVFRYLIFVFLTMLYVTLYERKVVLEHWWETFVYLYNLRYILKIKKFLPEHSSNRSNLHFTTVEGKKSSRKISSYAKLKR